MAKVNTTLRGICVACGVLPLSPLRNRCLTGTLFVRYDILSPIHNMSTTTNQKLVRSTAETVYRAFTDPQALETWLAPGEMTGKIHRFDLRAGGGYEMSLYYPSTDKAGKGKSASNEDRFIARFLELSPPATIVQAIKFNTEDPAFSGEMIMECSFKAMKGGTMVTITFKNIPPGIKPADNEKGTALSLEKLARYLERNPAAVG
jgi:uncharacterized protein YndB with AHSA1/START domain